MLCHDESARPAEAPVATGSSYLYCVADSSERVSLGKIGIEGNEVCTITYRDLCAVAHYCPQVSRLEDRELMKAWVMAHHKVVEVAWERWGAVLPLSFGNIIAGGLESGPEEKVFEWLKGEYETLSRRMAKVRGKAEYGVQVFWQPKLIASKLAEEDAEIKALEEAVKSQPAGLAYMNRQRLENLVKRKMENKADECFKDFHNLIRNHVEDIHIEKEKMKKAETGLPMLLNLSCLVSQGKYKDLGEALESINRREGVSVRFTGPWPPYSFAGGV
jgi:hypothetical protein